MNIYIDADGCPVVRETIEIARRFNLLVTVVCDTAHQFTLEGVHIVTVGQGSDAVDYEIINRLEAGDLVITQDYGLGALVLAKKGIAMNQNGIFYDEETIDGLLYTRHLSAKLRQSGCRVKGPKKRKKEETQQFIKALRAFLEASQMNKEEKDES